MLRRRMKFKTAVETRSWKFEIGFNLAFRLALRLEFGWGSSLGLRLDFEVGVGVLKTELGLQDWGSRFVSGPQGGNSCEGCHSNKVCFTWCTHASIVVLGRTTLATRRHSRLSRRHSSCVIIFCFVCTCSWGVLVLYT